LNQMVVLFYAIGIWWRGWVYQSSVALLPSPRSIGYEWTHILYVCWNSWSIKVLPSVRDIMSIDRNPGPGPLNPCTSHQTHSISCLSQCDSQLSQSFTMRFLCYCIHMYSYLATII
jgi:hypothetical protein